MSEDRVWSLCMSSWMSMMIGGWNGVLYFMCGWVKTTLYPWWTTAEIHGCSLLNMGNYSFWSVAVYVDIYPLVDQHEPFKHPSIFRGNSSTPIWPIWPRDLDDVKSGDCMALSVTEHIYTQQWGCVMRMWYSIDMYWYYQNIVLHCFPTSY